MNWNQLALLLTGSSVVLLAPSLADACGGTFCDGANLMPVDQRGEDILFVQDGPEIEVHVRIQYTGEAQRFAWLVPLQALPEISIGSELLFANLGAATGPLWRSNLSYECSDENPNSSTSLTGGGFTPPPDQPDPNEPPYADRAALPRRGLPVRCGQAEPRDGHRQHPPVGVSHAR
jgi:hypothetical protein